MRVFFVVFGYFLALRFGCSFATLIFRCFFHSRSCLFFNKIILSGVVAKRSADITCTTTLGSSIIHMRGATPTTTYAEVKATLCTRFSSSSSTNEASSSRRRFRTKSRFGAFAFAPFGGKRNTSSSSSSSSGVCSDARKSSIARSEYYSDDRVLSLSSSS